MMALNVFLDPGVSPLLTRDVENSQQVLRVQGMLKINEVVPHRRLLHEDSHLHKVSERRVGAVLLVSCRVPLLQGSDVIPRLSPSF